jgi:hypothetical protein
VSHKFGEEFVKSGLLGEEDGANVVAGGINENESRLRCGDRNKKGRMRGDNQKPFFPKESFTKETCFLSTGSFFLKKESVLEKRKSVV